MIHTLSGALGLDVQDISFWLPLAVAGLLYLIVFASVVLDGFDTGVGVLLAFAPSSLRNRMVIMLSPWRDVNELWLFLALGLFVAALPQGWAVVMGHLYLPLSLLAVGVLLRSTSFELRLRSPLEWQHRWLWLFSAGSWLTAVAHGLILSRVLTDYAQGYVYSALSLFFIVVTVAAFALLGSTWLIMREAGELRIKATIWARFAARWVAAGAVAVSVVPASINAGVFLKWGDNPDWLLVASVWGVLLISFVMLEIRLHGILKYGYSYTAIPFALTLIIILIVLTGITYSFFPYLVLDNITIWDAAASMPSLRVVVGLAMAIVPLAIVFNIWVYKGLFGRSKPLRLPPFPNYIN